MRILVTGATGFIGRAVCRALLEANHEVRACVRELSSTVVPGCQLVVVGEIDGASDWTSALDEMDAIVHLASRTHLADGGDAFEQYHRVNVEGSAHLARVARESGVGTFVYMSSIKVNGERSAVNADGQPIRFSGDDTPRPITPYGQTKWQAEQALREITRDGEMQLTVLRPPLVYGPGQKANLLQLMRAIDRGIPLPFAGLDNRRSLVDVDNLADAVVLAVGADRMAAGTYTVADVDLSTPDLINAMAAALGKRPRLFPLPLFLLSTVATLTGREAQIEKITGTLIVDSERIATELSWVPQRSLEESMGATAAHYRASCAET